MGYLVVISGPMFAGKTTLLIRELLTIRQINSSVQVLVINHTDDSRNGGHLSPHITTNRLSSDDFDYIQSSELNSIDVDRYDVIAVDEAQFFDDLTQSVEKWLKADKTVYCAGLTLDYMNKPFGHLLELVPHADQLHMLKAKCVCCLEQAKKIGLNTAVFQHSLTNAIYSKRVINSNQQKVIGNDDVYQPVCRYHYYNDVVHNTTNGVVRDTTNGVVRDTANGVVHTTTNGVVHTTTNGVVACDY